MDAFVGEVRLLPTRWWPVSALNGTWFACNGQLISVKSFPGLFMVIKTTYGGDGETSFAVPNLNGRIPVGLGTGPGGTNWKLNTQLGDTIVTLGTATVPPHSHAFYGQTAVPPPAGMTGKAQAQSYLARAIGAPVASGGPPRPISMYSNALPQTAQTVLDMNMTASCGPGDPHDNMQPFMVMAYFIAASGIYPEPA